MLADDILNRLAIGDSNSAFLLALEGNKPRNILELCAVNATFFEQLLEAAVDANHIDAVGVILAASGYAPPSDLFPRVRSEPIANAIVAASNSRTIRMYITDPATSNGDIFQNAMSERIELGREWHREIYINGKAIDSSALQHAIISRVSNHAIEVLSNIDVSQLNAAVTTARDVSNFPALLILANNNAPLNSIVSRYPCSKCFTNQAINLMCQHLLCISCIESTMSCSLCNEFVDISFLV